MVDNKNNFKQTEIGLIPEAWDVVRLEEVFGEVDLRVKDLKNINPENLTVLSLTKNYGLIPQNKRFKRRIAIKDVANYKVVRKFQVVYNPYVIWEGAIHGLRTMEIGTVSPVYCVWECKSNSDPSFIDRLLRTPKLLSEYLARASGVVNRRRSISKGDFLNIKIPLPPLSEQKKIARVLDKIQQAIEIQDRIIEQTRNLKKSLMQKLFTEGLYGEKQKETEIGLIPKSWKAVRLGEMVNIFDKYRIPLSENIRKKQKKIYPYCGANGIIDYVENYLFDGEYLLLAEDGGHWGKFENSTYIMKGRFWVNNHAHVLKAKNEKTTNYFLMNILNYLDLTAYVTGDARGKINQGTLKSIKIPLPPLEEQKQIAHILSVVDKKIEGEKKRKQVLKELFKTMFHKLISGDIRLKEVEV